MNKYNKIFLYVLVPYIILLLGANQANATSATFMEGQFEEVMTIPKVDSIEAWAGGVGVTFGIGRKD